MIFSCIRHGRTEMNAQDLVCGVTDIPLIELGIQQAKNASEDIFEKIQTGVIPPIDMIISSPLLRAQQRVQSFYENLGYTRVGDVYYDEYCPHVKMIKEV